MPSKNHGKKIRPLGRILHSVSALTGQTSYISPEPKRCVERKVLNCPAHIIANIHPAVGGGNLQKIAQGNSWPRLSFRGKVGPVLNLYCHDAVESHAGIFISLGATVALSPSPESSPGTHA